MCGNPKCTRHYFSGASEILNYLLEFSLVYRHPKLKHNHLSDKIELDNDLLIFQSPSSDLNATGAIIRPALTQGKRGSECNEEAPVRLQSAASN
jgi:hypothetical protein